MSERSEGWRFSALRSPFAAGSCSDSRRHTQQCLLPCHPVKQGHLVQVVFYIVVTSRDDRLVWLYLFHTSGLELNISKRPGLGHQPKWPVLSGALTHLCTASRDENTVPFSCEAAPLRTMVLEPADVPEIHRHPILWDISLPENQESQWQDSAGMLLAWRPSKLPKEGKQTLVLRPTCEMIRYFPVCYLEKKNEGGCNVSNIIRFGF